MMKKIVIAAIAATSFSAVANLPKFVDRWILNPNGVPMVIGYDYKHLALFDKDVQFATSGKCYKSEDDMDQLITKVNGKPVKMARYCFKGNYRIIAVSQKGKDYIFSEFNSKNKVTAFNTTFSATDFRKTVLEAITMEQDAL
ncbi:TPA: hypothetical protein ACX6PV_000862 [Photobacterium damselae]